MSTQKIQQKSSLRINCWPGCNLPKCIQNLFFFFFFAVDPDLLIQYSFLQVEKLDFQLGSCPERQIPIIKLQTLYIYIYVYTIDACTLSHFSGVWLFATLWTIAHQAPLCMGFSRQEHWSGLSCPPQRHLPHLGIKPTSLKSPAFAGRFFTTSTAQKAHAIDTLCKIDN